MLYYCNICKREVDVDDDYNTVVVKGYFDNYFAHKDCAERKGKVIVKC